MYDYAHLQPSVTRHDQDDGDMEVATYVQCIVYLLAEIP